MKRKYTVDIFSGDGWDELIAGIDEYQKWVEEKAQKLIDRLASEGYQIANAGFQTAAYDGDNDCSVSIDESGEMAKAVVAVGESVLFIEFGTGVYYPDDHPEKPDGIVGRGEYGKGYGKTRTWGYYGDNPGTNGQFATKKDGSLKEPHVVLTHGNPANMPMYNAVKTLEQDFQKIVREVFDDSGH